MSKRSLPKAAHHRGDFDRRARAVRRTANADPTTRCRRCHKPAIPGDPWEAGHTRDGDRTSPLAAEHRSCNRRAAAERTNALKAKPKHTSTTW